MLPAVLPAVLPRARCRRRVPPRGCRRVPVSARGEARACRARAPRSVAPAEYIAAVETPNPAAKIHVANNDYTWTGFQGVPCCWAEQSLRSVEKTLHDHWSLGRPAWLDEAYYSELLGA